MIVCKFGGSSVADASQIKKVRAILESNPERMVAVVSAPGRRSKDDEKITDLLYKCNSLVQKGQSCKTVFVGIAKRYMEIAEELKLDVSALSAKLDEIRYQLDGGKGADFAASRGEYLSAWLISQYLGWEFIDSADIIVINSDSTVNEATYQRVRARIQEGFRCVIPGFYGETEQGVLKTFTRGGSDITGAIIARSLGAGLYENWTDVSGIYRADPRVVEDAEVIPEISYKEVRELADTGASVFHEEAIAPVYQSGIPINVKNTDRPEDPGTMIVPESSVEGAVGVSVRASLSRLKVRKLMLFKKHGTRHALLTMLHVFGIRPCYSLYGIDSIVWFYDSRMASDSVTAAMCERLKKEFSLDECEADHGHAMLGIVGRNMDLEGGPCIKAIQALGKAGVDVTSINAGSSDSSILMSIWEKDSRIALKAVYDILFGSDE